MLEDSTVQLTPLDYWKVGGAWYRNKVNSTNGIKIEFSYWAGGGRDNSYGGADGFVLLFANTTYNLGSNGGSLGFVRDNAIGIEFDSYPYNSNDPSKKHIAVVQNSASNHLKSINDDRVDDSNWHEVVVMLIDSCIYLELDGKEVIRYDNISSIASELYIGVAASTGAGLNRHLIKDFIIRKGEVKNGFDLRKDGWPIRNYYDGFGYSNPYYIPANIYNETLGIVGGSFFTSIEGWKIVFGNGGWGGNCFGLSTSSVLNYNEQIDLSSYFSNSHGKSLNEYGYKAITSDGSAYTLKNDRAIVSVIERMQLSQVTNEIKSCKVFDSLNQKKNLSDLIKYLNKDDSNPLIVCLNNHAVVTETKYKPEQTTFNGESGFYKIKIYNPNSPYNSGRLSSPVDAYSHSDDSFLYVNPDKGTWYFHQYSATDGLFWCGDSRSALDIAAGLTSIEFYDLSSLGDSFLEKKCSIAPAKGKQKVFLSYSDISISKNWETVFQSSNQDIKNIDLEITYSDIYNSSSDTDLNNGFITLNSGSITMSDFKNLYAFFVSDNNNYIYADIDANSKYTVNSHENNISMDLQKNASFDVVLDHDDGNDYSLIRIKGNAPENGNLSISLNYNNELSVDTNILNLEATVIVSDSSLEQDSVIENANVSELNGQNIISLDENHNDENHDGICDHCGFDLTKDCSCACHKTGILHFFWTIKNFFCRLFGFEQQHHCLCGKKHW